MVPEERALVHASNPMCEAFPRIAACEYVRYGSGGREDTRSAICILGLNMINDTVSFFGIRQPEECDNLKKTSSP